MYLKKIFTINLCNFMKEDTLCVLKLKLLDVIIAQNKHDSEVETRNLQVLILSRHEMYVLYYYMTLG